MIIINAYPPNIEKIRSVLNVDKKGIIYTYGHIIYNPDGGHIDIPLQFHEATHSLQQDKYGSEKWWDKYLEDPQFRLKQEVEAYRNQYNKFKKYEKDRNNHAKFLHEIAWHLASEQYGYITTHSEAKRLIQNGN